MHATVLKVVTMSFVGLCLVAPRPVSAQRTEQQGFGKCDHWLSQKVDVSDTATKRDLARLSSGELSKLMYRIGFAHGFTYGLFGNLYGYWVRDAALDARVVKLASYYVRGSVQVLERPAILMTALDSKCGDYRNRGLQLSDVGLFAVLEMGGLPTKQTEEGLRQLRVGSDHSAVLNVLVSGLE